MDIECGCTGGVCGLSTASGAARGLENEKAGTRGEVRDTESRLDIDKITV